jgi:hypothetical protein
MAAKKSTKKKPRLQKGKIIISDKVDSYENHPYFIKKHEDAQAFLKKAGIPWDLINKK